MLSITRIFRFEAAHSISDYKGLCSQIHGHSYELYVTVSGELKHDMIVDFKSLKKIVEENVIHEYDHALILKRNAVNESATKNLFSKICWLENEPTIEVLLSDFSKKIKQHLPQGITLVKLKLFETNSCYAEWEED